MQTLRELVDRLPPDLRQEVRDFVEFLLERRARKPRGAPLLDWAGALADLRDQHDSVELQHRIAESRMIEP